MSEHTISCPRCDFESVIKNGFIPNGNQNFKCKKCGRQFILNPKNKPIAQETKELTDKLLLEKLSLAGIARVTGVSKRGLQNYVNTLYASVSKGKTNAIERFNCTLGSAGFTLGQKNLVIL